MMFAVRKILRISTRYSMSEKRAVLPVVMTATGTMLFYVSRVLAGYIVDQAQFVATTYGLDTQQIVAAGSWLSILTLAVAASETGVVMTRIVSARIKSIGVMRATGINNVVIFSLFLSETATYGLIGGFIGALAGAAATVIIALFQLGLLALYPLLNSMIFSLGISIGVAILVSVAAGIYPCTRALIIPTVSALYSE